MSTKLLVRCSYVNQDTNTLYGEDPEPVEAFTDDRGVLFRDCQREYGRCFSSIYDDSQPGVNLGWVFVKREKYSDRRSTNTYLQETWVYVQEVVV